MGADFSVIEREIDEAFASNPLTKIPWTQGAWTILSTVEDHHFKISVVQPLPEPEATAYVDGLINAMTHPLRVLWTRSPRNPTSLNRRLVDTHYTQAQDWLREAEDYNSFCSIFPLYRANEISLSATGNFLEPTDWSKVDLSSEAYDRLVARRDPAQERKIDGVAIAASLQSYVRSKGGIFFVKFDRRLLKNLRRDFGSTFESRHMLPEGWKFSRFTLAQYRAVFITLQLAATAWFAARQIVAPGVLDMAYEGAVWTPHKSNLLNLLSEHNNLPASVVKDVLEYLTYGEIGIRNPDVAIQPLIDLGNDHYGISPFLMTQIHAERNLCVLLNQVPDDRKLYARLVNEKEEHIRADTIESLKLLDLDFRHGRVGSTDVDLAIIDRKSRACLCVEIKWFIEPAEIREVIARSEELEKGICQAKLLASLFSDNDERLMTLLGISRDYEFLAMVGSVNSIGRPGIQDSDIPITKLWHLVSKINETRSLRTTINWLRNRDYFPVRGRDYRVQEVSIQSGRWKSRWYGIAHVQPNECVETDA